MSVDLWLAFVAASAVLLIIPGPTILTVISYSMAHGRRQLNPVGDVCGCCAPVAGLAAGAATVQYRGWFAAVGGGCLRYAVQTSGMSAAAGGSDPGIIGLHPCPGGEAAA